MRVPLPSRTAFLAATVVTLLAAARAAQAQSPEGVLALMNAARASGGVSPLTMADELTQACTTHAQDMFDRGYADHYGSDGRDPGQRVLDAGYVPTAWRENVGEAWATDPQYVWTDQQMFDWWMGSPGHHDNILAGDVTEAGVGVAEGWSADGAYHRYWCVVFGDREQQAGAAPPAEPAPPGDPVPPPPADHAQAVLDLMNAARASAGLNALAMAGELTQACTAHAQDMFDRGYADHQGSDGRDPGQRILDAGYVPAAWRENVGHAWATDPQYVWTDQQMFDWWMGSPGHHDNILAGDVTEAGVGVAEGWSADGAYHRYWCVVFGDRAP